MMTATRAISNVAHTVLIAVSPTPMTFIPLYLPRGGSPLQPRYVR